MDNTEKQHFSIGEFFEQHEVRIPILQRDYAQGREGKEYIREVFLKDIFDAVTSNKPLMLDFIYGFTEGNVFYPLDGQQRLTTLWLIYWYMAVQSDSWQAEKLYLKRFSYQTRKSSRAFCQALCNNFPDSIKLDNEDVVAYIKNQPWFFAAWEKDPTISAMLRMLDGTTNKQDGIACVFRGIAKKKNKWTSQLVVFKNNISFFVFCMFFIFN